MRPESRLAVEILARTPGRAADMCLLPANPRRQPRDAWSRQDDAVGRRAVIPSVAKQSPEVAGAHDLVVAEAMRAEIGSLDKAIAGANASGPVKTN